MATPRRMHSALPQLLGIMMLSLASVATGVREGDGVNLPAESSLRVGVMRRASNTSCAGARKGDRVSIAYEGRLFKDGTMFDASQERSGEPFEFTVGAGQVVKGLEDGLLGICIDEARRIIIPRWDSGKRHRIHRDHSRALLPFIYTSSCTAELLITHSLT